MQKAKGGSGQLQKLVDIVEFPDLGGDPELIDVTTLSDPMQLFILGIQSNDGLSFSANYNHDDYAKITALKGTEQSFAVAFGDETGSEGLFTFDGYIDVHVTGAGVNDKVSMSIMIAPTTAITDETHEA
jgi:hypothetical protein